jgi:hypothetical protein
MQLQQHTVSLKRSPLATACPLYQRHHAAIRHSTQLHNSLLSLVCHVVGYVAQLKGITAGAGCAACLCATQNDVALTHAHAQALFAKHSSEQRRMNKSVYKSLSKAAWRRIKGMYKCDHACVCLLQHRNSPTYATSETLTKPKAGIHTAAQCNAAYSTACCVQTSISNIACNTVQQTDSPISLHTCLYKHTSHK